MEFSYGSEFLAAWENISASEKIKIKEWRVGGSLNLSGTQITSLPEGLKVGGSLDLSGTQITSLPEGLKKKAIY